MSKDYDWDALAVDFPQEVIKSRPVGSGVNADYITSRTVMYRLDEIIGPANWQDTYEMGEKGTWVCTLSILINGVWVGKSGAGVNRALTEKEKGSKFEDEAMRKNIKGGASDAFKRAAVKWGIGRHLYQDKPTGKRAGKKAPASTENAPVSERTELVKRIADTWYGGNRKNALDALKRLYETKVDDQRVIHAGMDDLVIWKAVAYWVWPESLPGQIMLAGHVDNPSHAYNLLNKMATEARIGITDSAETILAAIAKREAEKAHNDT